MALLKRVVIEMEMTPHDGHGFFAHYVDSYGRKQMLSGVASHNKKLAITEVLKDVKHYMLEGK